MVKTRFAVLSAVLTLCIAIGGCGSRKTGAEINVDSAAQKILSEVEFEDELAMIDSEAITYLYGTDDSEDAAVYMGSGATAEEIAVFDAGDGDGGEEILEIVKKHVADQIESYRYYVPSEVARLENAVIRREGRYVFLCITKDTAKARAVIDGIIND